MEAVAKTNGPNFACVEDHTYEIYAENNCKLLLFLSHSSPPDRLWRPLFRNDLLLLLHHSYLSCFLETLHCYYPADLPAND